MRTAKDSFLTAPDSPAGLQLAAEYAVSTRARRQDTCWRSTT